MRRTPSVLLLSVLAHAVALLLLGTAPWWSPITNWPMPHEVLAFSESPRLARLQDIELPRPPRARVGAPASSAGPAPEPAPVVASTGVAPDSAEPGLFNGPAGPGVETPGTGAIEGVGVTSAPPPPPRPPAQEPRRPGGDIRPPTKVVHVAPEYPAIARTSRVQGVVILETIIDAQGNVQSAMVLRSIPLLDQAALDAVRQWKFTPTMLNGVAIPVVLTVTVNFELSR